MVHVRSMTCEPGAHLNLERRWALQIESSLRHKYFMVHMRVARFDVREMSRCTCESVKATKINMLYSLRHTDVMVHRRSCVRSMLRYRISCCTCESVPETFQCAHVNLVHMRFWSCDDHAEAKFVTTQRFHDPHVNAQIGCQAHVMVQIWICQCDEDHFAKFGKACRCRAARAKLCQKQFTVQISLCTCEAVSEIFDGAHVNLVYMSNWSGDEQCICQVCQDIKISWCTVNAQMISDTRHGAHGNLSVRWR